MKFFTRSYKKSETEPAAASSIESLRNCDCEVFARSCSDTSDCEICETRVNQLCYSTPHASASAGRDGRGLRLQNAMEPLLGSRPRLGELHRVYGSTPMSDDSLGPADFKSGELLDFYKRTRSQNPQKKKQSSLVTIFSVWNTMLGSSLLAMAWGVGRAGLVSALLLTASMGALCLFTAYILLTVRNKHGGARCEVPALCRVLLGRWAELLAHTFSLLVLLGANIVYWILVSNFLYFTVNYIADINSSNGTHYNSTVICPKHDTNGTVLIPSTAVEEVASEYWGLHTTVPIYVAIILFPLLNFRSASFFTKFNSLGTLSVVYLLIFVAVKGLSWGIHEPAIEIGDKIPGPRDAAVLSGMLALSFYIHNIIITIMSSNARQENNGRDLTIAFLLVTMTYALVGAVFYVCFPLAKSCIEDNILNNFEMHDVMTAVARALLLFQIVTVYPLLAFMLRSEAILLLPIKEELKSRRCLIVAINVVIVMTCIIFACFCPSIGTIIRYTGAVSGLVHVFALPSLLQLRSLQLRGKLTSWRAFFYVTIISFGTINFVMQFFISDKV